MTAWRAPRRPRSARGDRSRRPRRPRACRPTASPPRAGRSCIASSSTRLERLRPHRGHDDHVGGAVEREQLALRQHAQRVDVGPPPAIAISPLPANAKRTPGTAATIAVERLQQHRRSLPERELARVEHQRAGPDAEPVSRSPRPPRPTAPRTGGGSVVTTRRARPQQPGRDTRRGCRGSRRSRRPTRSQRPLTQSVVEPRGQPQRRAAARARARRARRDSARDGRARTCRRTARYRSRTVSHGSKTVQKPSGQSSPTSRIVASTGHVRALRPASRTPPARALPWAWMICAPRARATRRTCQAK